MTQTLPAWLPAVIAGGLVAAVVLAVVGVASAAVDWLWPQEAQEGASVSASRPQTPTGHPRRVQPITQPYSPRNAEPKEHAMTATHTRTHIYVSFANPFLVCDLCRQPVPRWHNNDKCGCDEECWNEPCSHNAGITSVCPSWNPVDGCCCQEALGSVDHGPAPRPA